MSVPHWSDADVSKQCTSRQFSCAYSALRVACMLTQKVIRRSCGHTTLDWRRVVDEAHYPRQLTSRGDHFENRDRRRKIRNHAQDVYQTPRNTGILGDRPISSLKHARGSRGTPTSGNTDSLMAYYKGISHTHDTTLYPVPSCCFCEESLEDVHLEPVQASTKCKEEGQETYIAMAMTANVSKTAYQNRRLEKRGERRCQWDICTKV